MKDDFLIKKPKHKKVVKKRRRLQTEPESNPKVKITKNKNTGYKDPRRNLQRGTKKGPTKTKTPSKELTTKKVIKKDRVVTKKTSSSKPKQTSKKVKSITYVKNVTTTETKRNRHIDWAQKVNIDEKRKKTYAAKDSVSRQYNNQIKSLERQISKYDGKHDMTSNRIRAQLEHSRKILERQYNEYLRQQAADYTALDRDEIIRNFLKTRRNFTDAEIEDVIKWYKNKDENKPDVFGKEGQDVIDKKLIKKAQNALKRAGITYCGDIVNVYQIQLILETWGIDNFSGAYAFSRSNMERFRAMLNETGFTSEEELFYYLAMLR